MKLIAATLFVCVAALALMDSVYGSALPQPKTSPNAVEPTRNGGPDDVQYVQLSANASESESDAAATAARAPAPEPEPEPAPAPAPEANPRPAPDPEPTLAPGPNADPAAAPEPEITVAETIVLDEVAEDMPAGPSPMEGVKEVKE